MEKRTISFSPPDISELEIAEVCEALRSGWITTGPRTKLLEKRLAAFVETGRTDIDCSTQEAVAKYSNRVACLNSATSAEELNLRVLGVKEGDEVIVPAYTYTSTASAVVHCGATVRFVDIQKDGDPSSHMPEMDYEKLEQAITPKTKAKEGAFFSIGIRRHSAGRFVLAYTKSDRARCGGQRLGSRSGSLAYRQRDR